MPELSGLRLVKKLRAARMALPVILASGTLTQLELSRNPWLQLSGVLLKPFSPDQLLEAVESVLHVKSFNPNAGNANLARVGEPRPAWGRSLLSLCLETNHHPAGGRQQGRGKRVWRNIWLDYFNY